MKRDSVARLVGVTEASFPQRRPLLEAVRTAIEARAGAAVINALVAALDAGAVQSQKALADGVAALGGKVEHHWWLIPAAAVRVPIDAVDALAGLPMVTWVRPDAVFAAHIKDATSSANHNADHVQRNLGLFGEGANLALLDSGIDAIHPGTGLPHRAFDDSSATTRIRQTLGMATPGDTEDTVGHGSAVAGIALGRDWQATSGLSDDGFAPGAGVVSYKITRPGTLDAPESAVIAAWHQLARDRINFDLRVANLSYGGSPDPTSPAQRVLDRIAYHFDVLVVTSAGNDGHSRFPTANSQSNANGLTVGAVWSGSGAKPHRVWEFSSPGPLVGDGARTFPDLMAVGDRIVTVALDDNTRHTTQTGTSFAAPQVAGTALLLRGAHPNLTFLDTKALILNNVAELASRNPGGDRFAFGLGLLRTDLAVDAMLANQVLHGTVDANARSTVDFTVQVTAGTGYAATLAWPRITPDFEDPAWDDLDLEVRHAGQLIAESASPRNLYERALFTPTQSGTYTITVRAARLLSAAVPFSIAVGENRGGGRQPGSYDAFGTGCAGTSLDVTKGVVVPPAGRAFGNTQTRVPFAYFPTRLQQVFSGSTLGNPRTIAALGFRRDEQQGDAPSFTADVEIRMGWTDKTPANLSTTFAANHPRPLTLVYRNRAARFLGTDGLPPGPRTFDFILPLDRPFELTAPQSTGAGPATPNLLIEFRVFSHSRGSVPFNLQFDALDDPMQRRVYTDGFPDAPTGSWDTKVMPISLIGTEEGLREPELHGVGLPQLGETFGVAVRHARPGAVAVLSHGQSNRDWGGLTLPFDLAPAGAPGCAILTDTFATVPIVLGSNGQGEVIYPVPADPQLTGTLFFNQALILDPGANALGIVVSNAGRALIGG